MEPFELTGSYGRLTYIRKDSTSGALVYTSHPINERVCTIGRHDDCHIRIRLLEISRRHIQIEFNEDGQAYLTAFNSAFVNDIKVKDKVLLKNGDVIRVLDRSFIFEYAENPGENGLFTNEMPLMTPKKNATRIGTIETPKGSNSSKSTPLRNVLSQSTTKIESSDPKSIQKVNSVVSVKNTPAGKMRVEEIKLDEDVISRVETPMETRVVRNLVQEMVSLAAEELANETQATAEENTVKVSTPKSSKSKRSTPLKLQTDLSPIITVQSSPVRRVRLENPSPSRMNFTPVVRTEFSSASRRDRLASSAQKTPFTNLISPLISFSSVKKSAIESPLIQIDLKSSPVPEKINSSSSKAASVRGSPLLKMSPLRKPQSAQNSPKSSKRANEFVHSVHKKSKLQNEIFNAAAEEETLESAVNENPFVERQNTPDVVPAQESQETPSRPLSAESTGSVQKSVTFGPPLSPEIFDMRQPAMTPVRRGKKFLQRQSLPGELPKGILRSGSKNYRNSDIYMLKGQPFFESDFKSKESSPALSEKESQEQILTTSVEEALTQEKDLSALPLEHIADEEQVSNELVNEPEIEQMQNEEKLDAEDIYISETEDQISNEVVDEQEIDCAQNEPVVDAEETQNSQPLFISQVEEQVSDEPEIEHEAKVEIEEAQSSQPIFISQSECTEEVQSSQPVFISQSDSNEEIQDNTHAESEKVDAEEPVQVEDYPSENLEIEPALEPVQAISNQENSRIPLVSSKQQATPNSMGVLKRHSIVFQTMSAPSRKAETKKTATGNVLRIRPISFYGDEAPVSSPIKVPADKALKEQEPLVDQENQEPVEPAEKITKKSTRKPRKVATIEEPKEQVAVEEKPKKRGAKKTPVESEASVRSTRSTRSKKQETVEHEVAPVIPEPVEAFVEKPKRTRKAAAKQAVPEAEEPKQEKSVETENVKPKRGKKVKDVPVEIPAEPKKKRAAETEEKKEPTRKSRRVLGESQNISEPRVTRSTRSRA